MRFFKVEHVQLGCGYGEQRHGRRAGRHSHRDLGADLWASTAITLSSLLRV